MRSPRHTMVTKDEIELRKELRDYAWKYFDRHAGQRLIAFNFYLALSGIIVAGLFAILREEVTWAAPVLAAILTYVSFVFWKIDCRTRTLTKHSENALKFIEGMLPELTDEVDGTPHICKLFQREKHDQKRAVPRELTYTDCFGRIFWLFGVGGIVLAISISLYLITPRNAASTPPIAVPTSNT
jgi:hypothetical protein